VGTQLVDDLAAHEARSAARRLVAGLFDAWDAGDVEALVAHFTLDAMWTDPAGERSLGTAELAAHYLRWREWEPFSVHWLGNEQVLAEPADPGRMTGSWLWSAASNVDRGATAAWSGGDLKVSFRSTDAGWRIESLLMVDRYRTPYHVGWLDQLLVQPGPATATADTPAGRAVGTAVAHLPPAVPPGPPGGTDSARRERLAAETRVRWTIGEYADAVELLGEDASTLAAYWTEDAACSLFDVADASGCPAVLAAHLADAARASAWIRALMSLSIDVAPDGDRASAQWRDIWTAEVGGEARWLAHAYRAELVAGAEGWQLSSLQRRPLLDCSYEEGWNPGNAPGPAEGSIES
jgi:ketosteroid isomerase-like protein